MESIGLKIYKNRLLVADLISDVLTSKLTVMEAVSRFPTDKNDINIKCAFDALIYREADEDLRKNIKGYKELQDDLLETIANILKENQRIPKNIISKYYKFHKEDIIYKKQSSFLKEIIQSMKRKINF